MVNSRCDSTRFIRHSTSQHTVSSRQYCHNSARAILQREKVPYKGLVKTYQDCKDFLFPLNCATNNSVSTGGSIVPAAGKFGDSNAEVAKHHYFLVFFHRGRA